MSWFIVELKPNEVLNNYLDKVKYKLNKPNLFVNAGIKKLNDNYFMFSLPHIFPRAYMIGIYIFAIAMLFSPTSFNWAHWTGLILFSTGFFWSNYFMFFVFRFFLKRKGYKEPIKKLSNDRAISLLCGYVLNNSMFKH